MSFRLHPHRPKRRATPLALMAALLLALAALLSPTVARAEGSVVYVSNDGTGDGTAAELPTKLTSALIGKFNGRTTVKLVGDVVLDE